MVVRGIGFGEVTPGKNHPGGVLVKQHVTYSRSDRPLGPLAHSTGVKCSWARAPPTTSANAGKMGLFSSGRTSPTRRAALAPELGGAFVAQHVQSSEHRRTSGGGDPGPPVEDAAHSRLTDTYFVCYGGQAALHVP